MPKQTWDSKTTDDMTTSRPEKKPRRKLHKRDPSVSAITTAGSSSGNVTTAAPSLDSIESISRQPMLEQAILHWCQVARKRNIGTFYLVKANVQEVESMSTSDLTKLIATVTSRHNMLKTRDCQIHRWVDMKTYQEGFYFCVIYRQILEFRKQPDYTDSLEQRNKIAFLERFQPFTGFRSKITIKEIMLQYDWSKPLPHLSQWLLRRRELIERVSCYFRNIPETQDESDFWVFVFSYVLYNTGSSLLVDAIQNDLSKLRWHHLKAPGYLISAYLKDIDYQAFHSRYRPNLIRANGIKRALHNGDNDLWRDPVQFNTADSDSGEDEQAIAIVATNKEAEHQPDESAISCAAALCIKYLEELPKISQLRAIHQQLMQQPNRVWTVLSKLPGFGGSGYNLQNFALLWMSRIDTDRFSSGGTGPRQSYNLQLGRCRKQRMETETLQALIQTDTVAFRHYWTGNFFGSSLFTLLDPIDRRVGCVTITHNRCMYDKIGWKIASQMRPPVGFATWREYVKSLTTDDA
jgi:hypothetical protein